MNPALYLVEGSAAEVLDRVAASLRLAPGEARRERETYFDTFDWDLAERGWSLARSEREGREHLVLEGPEGGPWSTEVVQPGDPARLPEGALAAAVRPVAGLRHLLPQVEVLRRVRTWRVLDGEDKTVVRLELHEGSARDLAAGGARPRAATGSALLPAVLVLRPLRGYHRAFAAAMGEVARHLAPLEGTGLDLALASVGRDRASEASPPSPLLRADERADVALARLLASLAETVADNVPGTVEDLDTEFLHDLRVAVRRTRSALSQVKDVLPDPPLQAFRGELKWLGDVTGPVRDLDVFLLGFDGLVSQVSPAARGDLEPLRRHLEERREEERKRLRRALRSKRCRQLLRDWSGFLAEVAEGRIENDAPRAARPVASVAAKRIRRTARKLREGGRAIDEASAPEELHSLRIAGKKLRYLLELFRGLLEPGAWARQHAALKKLQSVLGDYNDCAVQEAALARFARELAEEGGDLSTTLAIGRLSEHVALRAQKLRGRFHEVFLAFDTPELRGEFDEMLEHALDLEGTRR